MAKTPDTQQERVAAAINGRLGGTRASVFSRGSGFAADATLPLPFGISAVDRFALSCGGLMCGRFAELYGEEGAGKSTLCLHAAASCQLAGGTAVLIHTEHALTAQRLHDLGVDRDELVLIEPETMEDCLKSIEAALAALANRPNKDRTPALIAWDSLAASPPAAEVKAGVAPAKGFDTRAKMLSAAYRLLARAAAQANAAVLVVNQNRTKIGVMFGNPTTTPGGAAPKYHSSMRIELFPGKQILDGGLPVGKQVTLKVWKNKLGPPLRKVPLRLLFARGFDDDRATLDLARGLGLVSNRASAGQARQALDAIGWQPKAGMAAEFEDDDEEEDDDD